MKNKINGLKNANMKKEKIPFVPQMAKLLPKTSTGFSQQAIHLN